MLPRPCGRGSQGIFMPTNSTRSQQTSGGAAAQAVLAKETSARRMASDSGEKAVKVSGYGLPCAKCHLYYPADLDACPTCKHNQRVSPIAPKLAPKPLQTKPEPV